MKRGSESLSMERYIMINYQIIIESKAFTQALSTTQVITYPQSDLLKQLGLRSPLVEQLNNYSANGQVADCQFGCEPVGRLTLIPENHWLSWPEGQLLTDIRSLVKAPLANVCVDCRLFDLSQAKHRGACQQLLILLFNQSYSLDDQQFKTTQTVTQKIKNLIFYSHVEQVDELNKLAQHAFCVSKGMIDARQLADIPSDICTPAFVADTVTSVIANYPSLSASILDEKEVKAQGFGLLHAVGKGAKNPPRIVIIRYQGSDDANNRCRAYVGKGVTYDTGGYWLKSGDGMYTMKYDMCGAANVFGLLVAAAEMKLPVNLVGILMLAENMIGPEAMRPSEIATSYSGLTVEINNTDAEGRLVLADGIAYASTLQPKYIIDVATLTGAVVKALGYDLTGLMSSDMALSADLHQAGLDSRDEIWALPLDKRLAGQVKSHIADACNTPSNNAAISASAAYFLSLFCPTDLPWAHLDVSGTALWRENGYSTASGRPIPLLIQHIMNDLEK
ncbi:leucyl aminopeptidase family protein [Providencia sp. Je.9.19]